MDCRVKPGKELKREVALLLCRRGGIEGGRIGRRRVVEPLDICGAAQLLHQLGLRPVGDIILDLAFDLVEFRGRLDALVLDFDDVPAELRFHRIGDLPLVELESDFGEFRHHLVLGEITEIAAL